MPKERKALIVHHHVDGDAEASVAALNAHLADEWTIVSVSAMGGAGTGPGTPGPEFHFAALVILEREEKRTVGGFRAA